MMLSRLTVACLCFVTASCGRADQPETSATAGPPRDSAVGRSAPSAAVGQASSPCPRTGRWAVCSLEKRLEQSGFVLKKGQGEPARRSGFSVKPVVYTLGGRARLEVFVYPDEAALTRDVAKMDTALAAPRGQSNDWEIPPRFIRSGNLVAVLLTRNELQAERATLAITAGAPQPDP
ncbi:MAG: hypothetical protein WD802_06865 [Gemmatimonadaceae bacterium]